MSIALSARPETRKLLVAAKAPTAELHASAPSAARELIFWASSRPRVIRPSSAQPQTKGGPSAVQMVESFDVEAYLEAQIAPAAARQEDAHEQQDARGPVEHENRAHDRDGRPRDDQPRDHGVKRQRYDDRRGAVRSRDRDDRHRRYDYRDDRDGRRRGGERDDRRRDYDLSLIHI